MKLYNWVKVKYRLDSIISMQLKGIREAKKYNRELEEKQK